MLVVNAPTVVLASAQTRFLGPVVVGDRMEAEAAIGSNRPAPKAGCLA